MSLQRAFFLALVCGVLTAWSPPSAQEPRSTALQAPRQQMTQDGIARGVAFSPDARLGKRRRDDQAVGCGNWQEAGHPQGTHQLSTNRCVQSGRQDTRLGKQGFDDQAVGRAVG
jgi:hypothetical protein